jgi:hypothetical protein
VTGSTNGGEIDGLLTGVEATKAIAFYRTELPKAGYKITEDDTQGAGGSSIVHLAFAGHGFTGSISATAMGGADVVGINLTKA